jgi:hypothetical protein
VRRIHGLSLAEKRGIVMLPGNMKLRSAKGAKRCKNSVLQDELNQQDQKRAEKRGFIKGNEDGW